MTTYELVLIFDPNVESEQVENDLRKISELITSSGGMFRRWERWGKRRLAYEIRHRQYGQYVLTVYDLPSSASPDSAIEPALESSGLANAEASAALM